MIAPNWSLLMCQQIHDFISSSIIYGDAEKQMLAGYLILCFFHACAPNLRHYDESRRDTA